MTEEPGDEAAGGIRRAWRDNPEWRKLYLARAISLLGNWLNALVLVELLAGSESSGATDSAFALAIVFVLKQVPITLLGPAAGVIADRFDRRRILLVCELLAAAVVLLFLLLEPGEHAAWVYVLTAAQMGVSAFFLPAYQAMVPALVKPRDLVAANVLSSATWSVTFALGMAVGGVVLAVAGWRVAIVVDSLSYLLSAAIVLSVRSRSEPRERRRPRGLGEWLGLPDMRAGLAYIRGHADVSRIILVKFGWGSMGAVSLFLALLGRSDYQVDDSASGGVSYLWGCRALGTLFGPLLAYRFGRDDQARLEQTITWAFFATPLLYALFALVEDFWLGGFLVFAAHLGGSTLWVISTVLLQKIVPDEFRGRTFAAELGLVMLSAAASHLIYGAVIELGVLSVRNTLLLSAAVCLLPAVLWLRGAQVAQRA